MGNEVAIPNVRRSVHFRVENYEGTSLKNLSPKNQDVLTVKRRLAELGYDPAEIWKDTACQTPFYEKIVQELEGMLVRTQGAAQGVINPFQVNFIQVQSHGIMYQRDQLIAIPDGSNVKCININNYAQRFAEVPNSFNIFLIEACRIALKPDQVVNIEAAPITTIRKMPGISIIIHSCDPWQPSNEQQKGEKAWCLGTHKFLARLLQTQNKRQYSWMEFFSGYEPQLLTQISSLPYSMWKKQLIFAPRSYYEEYQKQIYRVLSCEPRFVETSQQSESMFNLGRVKDSDEDGQQEERKD